MAMRNDPPTLPKGVAPASNKKGGKKHTLALVLLGITIGFVVITIITATRAPSEAELAICDSILLDMQKNLLRIEQETVKAEAMNDMVKAYIASGLPADDPAVASATSLWQSNIDRANQLISENKELSEKYESYEQCQ